jgi:hypothetical protein
MKKVAFVLVPLSMALSLCVIGLLELQMVHASPYTDIDVDTANNLDHERLRMRAHHSFGC